jgi:hypothetical protein
MKNKPNIPEKAERLESLAVETSKQPQAQIPVPTDEERKKDLAPWQLRIVALAEARLSIEGEEDVINEMHRRAIGLCRVIEDFSLVGDDNDLSIRALGHLVSIVQEDIQVAQWITSGKPYRPTFE